MHDVSSTDVSFWISNDLAIVSWEILQAVLSEIVHMYLRYWLNEGDRKI